VFNPREHRILILVFKNRRTKSFEKINFLPSLQKLNVDWQTCRRPSEQRLL